MIRAERYATAVELAADLDRWMGDEAVLAHAKHETVFERAGRFLRRYRTWTVSRRGRVVGDHGGGNHRGGVDQQGKASRTAGQSRGAGVEGRSTREIS